VTLSSNYHHLVTSGKLAHLLPGRLPQLVLVEGPSMEPQLPNGAWAVLLPRPGRLPKVGQVVVAEHPGHLGFEMVKRVSAVSASRGLVWLAGDNREHSSDSEEFGPVRRQLVVGPVVAVVRPGRPHLVRIDPSRLW